MGQVSILNVGTGDTKLIFDKNNPSECIRASRIVKDMIRRGYALLVEFEKDGQKHYRRAKDFDETVCEYIIADFDPLVDESSEPNEESPEPSHEEGSESPAPKAAKRKWRVTTRRLPAESTNAVAVGRTAGG